jgi:acylphosphatase
MDITYEINNNKVKITKVEEVDVEAQYELDVRELQGIINHIEYLNRQIVESEARKDEINSRLLLTKDKALEIYAEKEAEAAAYELKQKRVTGDEAVENVEVLEAEPIV